MVDKLTSDLNFIRSLSTLCNQENWRLVLYGGYGLDFVLGKTTRPHRDIDAVIFGKDNRADAMEKLSLFLTGKLEQVKLITKNQDFLVDIDIVALNFAANLYYVQTVNDPELDLHTVLKQNGEEIINSEERFPNPVKGKLNGLIIDVQDQNAHLADILIKRGKNSDSSKYDQDISYLRQITDAAKVDALIAQH